MIPAWWSTISVGDKLRRMNGPDQKDDKLLHVVCVFDDDWLEGHESERFIVSREWWRGKQRWHYVVHRWTEALVGLIYPDGEDRPKR